MNERRISSRHGAAILKEFIHRKMRRIKQRVCASGALLIISADHLGEADAI
jgi:hypothetical protein